MWAQKLGLPTLEPTLLNELFQLMMLTRVDYTIFFRELTKLPSAPSALKRSFYLPSSEELNERWGAWLRRWRELVIDSGDPEERAAAMRRVNPSVTWREWLIAPAYQQAERGDYTLIHELQEVFRRPYHELDPELASTYDELRPRALFNVGGVSHYSCSS